MLRYIKLHWQGRLSLRCSFWINLVALRIVVFLTQDALAPAEGADYSHHIGVVVLCISVFHIVLLVWSLVGVARAADNHFAENGNMSLVWGAQLSGVLLFVLTALYALGALQMAIPASQESDVLKQMASEHEKQYSLTLAENDEVLFIQGSIELGITRAVGSELLQHPEVHTIVLDSQGGNIFEARGLAQLFVKNALATHVRTSCASACTMAFVGGASRSADEAATFGFHQYRVDAGYAIITTDVGKEQSRDQQRLLDAGVSSTFVDTVFSQPSNEMWWPELSLLQDVRFLHSIEALSATVDATPPSKPPETPPETPLQ